MAGLRTASVARSSGRRATATAPTRSAGTAGILRTPPIRSVYAIDGNSCLRFESVDHPGILDWDHRVRRRHRVHRAHRLRRPTTPTSVCWTIECNPRATSGIMLFAPADGVDRAFFGNAGDHAAVGYRQDDRAGHADVRLKRKSLNGRSFRQFVRDFRHSRDVVWLSVTESPTDAPGGYLFILALPQAPRRPGEGFMHDHDGTANRSLRRSRWSRHASHLTGPRDPRSFVASASRDQDVWPNVRTFGGASRLDLCGFVFGGLHLDLCGLSCGGGLTSCSV